MLAATEAAIRIVEATGPWGALVVAALIGLVAGVLLLVYTRNLFAGSASEEQKAEFQERLIRVLDTLLETEQSLRKRLDDVEGENGALRDENLQLETTLSLIRKQRARVIQILQDVIAGHVEPQAIKPEELEEAGA